MKLTVTGRKIEITDGIRDHLNNKMEKTISDLGEAADVHVALAVEKHRHFAEITVKTKEFTLHSQDETNDLYTSMDKTLDKMEKQIRKHREKAKDMRNKKGSQSKNQILD
ncbi:MAG: ribosome-associated translation inhibitor RaiA [Nitrospina sp.]|jgi:putative sigma-54 modulation protein|nr:ribosome-associated translation inhibitor RaiA [Nitrospina sp.]